MSKRNAGSALALVLALTTPTTAMAWEVSFDPPVIFAAKNKTFALGLSILAEEGDEHSAFPNYGLLSYDSAVDGPIQIGAPLPLAICPGTTRYCWNITPNRFTTLFRIGNTVRISNFLTFKPNAETPSLPTGSYSFHISYGADSIIYLDLEVVDSLIPKPCNTRRHRFDHFHNGPGIKGIQPVPFTIHKHAKLCEEPIP